MAVGLVVDYMVYTLHFFLHQVHRMATALNPKTVYVEFDNRERYPFFCRAHGSQARGAGAEIENMKAFVQVTRRTWIGDLSPPKSAL